MTSPLAVQKPIVAADIYDQHHEQLAVCELQFRSFGRNRGFFGPCMTLRTFEDHNPVLNMFKTPGEGRVLVVDAGGSMRVGVMGDRLAEIGMKNGWRGIIIYGVIRDSLGIDALDFGAKALGTTARRNWVLGPTETNIPLHFGGVSFEPGDWVYADQDAVMVSRTQLDLSAL